MAPQTIAGRYHVQRGVGRGGMGTVWLCRDDVLGRDVAVKQVGTLPGEATPDLARALREARSSAALNHRNVVSIYDAVEDGDQIWLVMEYVPSRTLSEIVAEEGALSPQRVSWIGAQIADGLAAAHARGTIHRDVKPGNILVTDDDLAKISDFGIARTQGDAQLTLAGMVIGTPAYFSPELARGEEPSPAADVWALGATLYAAVEGRSLYVEQRNPIAMLAAIAAGTPARPQRADFLTEPIIRMLDPDPRSRWSMADVAHVLHRLHDQHAAGLTRAATSAFVAPVDEARATASSPVADEAVVSAGGEPRLPTGERSKQNQEPDGRVRRRGWAVFAGVLALGALVAAGLFLLSDLRPDGQSRTPSAASTGQRTGPTGQPTEEPPEEPVEEPVEEPDRSPPPTPSADAGSEVGAEAEQFVVDYYAVLPEDTETGWSLLSPEFRSQVGSYGSYRGFWSGLSGVDVSDTTPAGSNAVDVSLTYTSMDGRVENEVRRIYLEPAGSGFLIVDDEIVNP